VSHPFSRSPSEIAAAAANLAASGACCGHTFAAHAPDGCRVCQLQHRGATTGLCPGWRPVDPWTDPADPPNGYLVGIEDTDALPCSTPGCGHRAGYHFTDESQSTGLGACGRPGCPCRGWSYVIPDTAGDGEDGVDAEVLAPVHDAIRAVLHRYVPAPLVDQAVEDVVNALPADDVAEYLGLQDAVELLRQVVLDHAPPCNPWDGRPCSCSSSRARRFLARRGVQVG
jgi:hypothetical protein